ncbi:SulP family inorganic anion transporter [Paenibacillus psychroresistens]|uniref:SulP family inorganic anion transporter n=1 Tax=Paenibacillus psychroresistens TaxID=1778678 RepID=A0A6B8RI44_9BACL|nr:SulP family inorganic anion transporter [Paenibacillus psychroresistens]QGQ95557.1 SulP family inorganic anion transporter [Paenibacillus psychroresistens]
MDKLRSTWLFNIRGDVLAGITITLALIPDSIAFSFIAGVNPMIGLFSTVILMLIISFTGARPAMASAAAGSMAVLMTPLVLAHGVQYLFAATILTGVLMLLMGFLRMGNLMRFMPSAVVTGFINSLAILIFLNQLKLFIHGTLLMYVIVIVTLLNVYLLPLLIKAIPSPLIAVAAMTVITAIFHLPLLKIKDQAHIVTTLPIPGLPDIPFTWETLWIIAPFAISLAIVGYTESLLTQDIIDKMTATKTDKNRELKGLGFANTITGFFGGMAGCALVAESIINVKIGGRGRLSTLVGGATLLALILLFGQVVNIIPVAALVGVMLMICYEIMDWKSLLQVQSRPVRDTTIMVATVIASIWTNNLAIGVFVGVLLSYFIHLSVSKRLKLNKNME